MSEKTAIIEWNTDQREHEQINHRLLLSFCHEILQEAIVHDTTKWGPEEYENFLKAHDSLRNAATGTDKEYAKHFNTAAIQHHVNNNPHHPEYWDFRKKQMPVRYVIAMFYDWASRSIQKGTGLGGFWEYNLAKLENQPHAVHIVNALRVDFERGEP